MSLFFVTLVGQQIARLALKRIFKSMKLTPLRCLQAVGVFALLVAATFAFETKDRPASLFSVLGVARDAQRHEIKAAFKRQSILYHPDKNPGPEAEARFMHIKMAYDVVIDDNARAAYDRFGLRFADPTQAHAVLSEQSTYINFYLQRYAPALFLAFVSTRGEQLTGAFTWSLVPMFALALCDIFVRHSSVDYDFAVSILPYMTLNDKLEVLFVAFVYAVGVITFFVGSMYVNQTAVLLEHIQDLRAMVDVLMPADAAADGTNEAPRAPPHVRLANMRKQRALAHAQAAQGPQKPGINWMQLIFMGIFLYNLVASSK